MFTTSTRFLVAGVAAAAGLAAAADHQVVVGGAAGLKFVPEQVTAAIGDTVTYIFQSRNHTVTQSSFAAPCTLLQNATTGAVGFDSGYIPVAEDATQNPAWTVEILTDGPLWFFCAQGRHCQGGMVGAINAPTTGNRTFDAFKANAAGAGPASGGGSTVSSGIGAGATAPLSTVSSTATAAATTSTGAAVKRTGGSVWGLLGLVAGSTLLM